VIETDDFVGTAQKTTGHDPQEKSSAIARLLDRPASEEFLREVTASVARKKTETAIGAKSIVIFRIGTEWLSLSTAVFLEVADRATVRRLPGHLSGLVNVRGELILCVSLGAVLGLGEAPKKPETENSIASGRLMICKLDDLRLAFPVSEVYGLHRYDPKELRPAPATLARATGGTYTLGVLPWRDNMVGCLDHELLFYSINKGLL
jgi:chemotaxis-related protein WspD